MIKFNDKIKKENKKYIVFSTICFCLAVSMGAFAWFSIMNKSQVTELALSSGTEGNLLIAGANGSGPGEYKTEISLNESGDGVVLNPVTTKEGRTFYSPVYADGEVVNVKEITSHDDLVNEYIFEKDFYLKVENSGRGSSDEYYIFLTSNVNGQGSYFKDVSPGADSNDTAANAIRISLTIGEKTVVYEPNSDGRNTSTEFAVDKVSTGGYNGYSTEKQNKEGIFVDSTNGSGSNYLFKVKADVDNKVTMRIWIEGKDVDCTNSIQLDEVVGNLQFSSISLKNAQ